MNNATYTKPMCQRTLEDSWNKHGRVEKELAHTVVKSHTYKVILEIVKKNSLFDILKFEVDWLE